MSYSINHKYSTQVEAKFKTLSHWDWGSNKVTWFEKDSLYPVLYLWIWREQLPLFSSVVPNLSGTRDWLCGRQFFNRCEGVMILGWFKGIIFIVHFISIIITLAPPHIIRCRSWRLGNPVPQFSSVQSLSRVRLFATPWIAALQASLSITNSRSSPRLMSIKSVMPSSPCT